MVYALIHYFKLPRTLTGIALYFQISLDFFPLKELIYLRQNYLLSVPSKFVRHTEIVNSLSSILSFHYLQLNELILPQLNVEVENLSRSFESLRGRRSLFFLLLFFCFHPLVFSFSEFERLNNSRSARIVQAFA